MNTILVVDDEQPIRTMLSFALTRAGFALREAANAEQAQAAITEQTPQLILMDWMLPDMSGIELVKRLQRNPSTHTIPIIMLTAKQEEMDKITGFHAGVDDYMTKPFSPAELIARIQAVLRRIPSTQTVERLEAAHLILEPHSHRVSSHGQTLDLGPTEFRLLKFFMQNPDRVYSREQLLNKAWGRHVYVEERTVDVHILRLRKLLAPHGCDHYIQTVRGAGYRFSPNTPAVNPHRLAH